MTDFILQKKALDELSSLYQKEVSEKATPESGTGKYYNEKKPTSQQLEKREKMNKVKALTNAGKHQEASKLYKSTMKKEEVEKKTRLVTDKDRKNVKEFEAALKKANEKAKPYLKNESISNWRDDLREIVGTGGLGGDVEDLQSKKPNSEVIVKEKNVKNKVVIDPEVKLEQALGGKVIELKTVSEKMTTAALEDSPSDCPDCGEPVHEDECVAEKQENSVEESILWDRIARDLTKLGEMYDCKFKVEGYQIDPEQLDEKLAKGTKRVSFSTGRDDNYNQAMKEKNPRTGRMRATSPELKAIGAHSRHKKKQWDAEAKGDHKAAAKHKSRRDAQAFTVYQKTKRIIDRADND